ncbi:hypothetical protein JRQ81_004246 [Phrynocephalus forsythii]|uniref:Potassium channel domain-containing protein n=1 Tax=Phrynocephalus forsythii TaxID=171643 RepID=A0A9Q1B6F5_9SAUR|nr:hypothetical protein JRQ81_004246 [Phrynocephalus forsythii]
MVDRGPLLTSAIIFYLSIGAAIFEVLEEPYWRAASEGYQQKKTQLLKEFPCLGQEGLDRILQVVSEAAGQGVSIDANDTFNNWNWPNAVIFAATVITTIGYGNVAPKTSAGRLFCIFYGLFGVPLCLTWISALGSFWWTCQETGPVSDKKRSQPGVNPNMNYHSLYRYFVELWIYLGLAWLSLFVNWKVSMFVEVHKAIKKRRKKRKESFENHPPPKKALQISSHKDVNIFSFLSKKEETYNDLIKQIGKKALKTGSDKILNSEQSKPNMQHSGKELQVIYSRNQLFNYDEVSLGLQNYHVMKHLADKRAGDSSIEGNVFVNQLDRISEEEGEAWDSRDYRPLIFENANIAFVNEDEDEEEDLSDDEETSKSSMDDNLPEEPESPQKLVKFPSSDESTFTSNELEICVPYEQLMNEYNTVNTANAET